MRRRRSLGVETTSGSARSRGTCRRWWPWLEYNCVTRFKVEGTNRTGKRVYFSTSLKASCIMNRQILICSVWHPSGVVQNQRNAHQPCIASDQIGPNGWARGAGLSLFKSMAANQCLQCWQPSRKRRGIDICAVWLNLLGSAVKVPQVISTGTAIARRRETTTPHHHTTPRQMTQEHP